MFGKIMLFLGWMCVCDVGVRAICCKAVSRYAVMSVSKRFGSGAYHCARG